MESNGLFETIKTLFYLLSRIKLLVAACKATEENELYINNIKLNENYNYLPFGRIIIGTGSAHIIIMLCAFLDEYSSEFVHTKYPQYSKRIDKVRKSLKPVIKRINSWSGLRDYRNQVLAHNLRIKNGESLFLIGKEHSYKVPTTINELTLISELLSIIYLSIGITFPEILSVVFSTGTVKEKIKFEKSEVAIDVEKEIREIRTQVNKILRSCDSSDPN
ncbi:hypothetical protein [Larkinella punicea]|uniref:hypothetical protein n=1 Tax=Larkinella punicea TaxID=2315727 RepID=UPI001058EA00|nr:hypothetical protein [Larkinella punicea]